MADRTVRAKIKGRVQGVWFRAWTKQEADRLGLSGWVRNEADGSVSALVSGPEVQVGEMLTLLWQGPPAAEVANVTIEDDETKNPPQGFSVTG